MPDWKAYVREHLPPLAVGPARENEIVAELALQLEQAWYDARARGASEAEAARCAEGQFGDWNALAREINSAERPPEPGADVRRAGLAGTWRDVRYGMRFLRRNPWFAAIAVLTLAFGIGGNTAVFTMVDAVAFRRLPYPDAGRLVAIETRKPQQPELEAYTSALDFFDLRGRLRSFSETAAISPVWNVILTGRGEAERLECLYVSAGFFPMLGVNAAQGRVFLSDEDRRGSAASHVVLLSHSFWKRRFAGSPDIVGRPLELDGSAYTVAGVLPAGFRYAGEPLAGTASEIDAWFPLAANPIIDSIRAVRFLKVIGRLRPGVSAERARDEVRAVGAALVEQYPATNRGFAYGVEPLNKQVTGRFRVAMLLLLGAIGFVLLMACANVANLLLSRASARRRELAVRVALGASRFRLVRQLLTEGALLAAAAGLAGIALAWVGLRILARAAPPSLLHAGEIALDGRALVFTAAAALSCALLSGLPPAWRIGRADIESALRESGKSLTAGHHRARAVLVVAQVAVALILLVGAGLLIRSFRQVLGVDPGFDPRNLVTISTQMPQSARTPAERTSVYRRMRDLLAEVPGVASVAVVSRLPLLGSQLSSWMFVEGRSEPGKPGYDVEYRIAASSYFATMGIPLRAGRLYDAHDDANAASVVVINETAARRFWPGQAAVGRRVKFGANPEALPWVTVIGVVGDVHHVGMDIEPRPEIYRPYAHNPLGAPILVVRTSRDPAPLIGTLAARVRSAGAGVPAYNIYAMEALVARSNAQRWFVMLLLAGFAVSALLLAAVGVYGTVSQSVVLRTREIGLRVALGASPGAAMLLVFRQGLRLTAAGVLLGAAAAAALTRLLRRMLFEVGPLDPAAFAAAALILAGCALLACYVPARRATRVDPLVALREE